MAKILGINLGTTHSRTAVMKGGIPQVLENSEGQRSTPSVVAFNKTGDCFVGDAAARQSVTNTRNTIHSVKRLMGRNFGEVQDEIKFIPYKVVRGQNDDALIEVELDGKQTQLSPAEISAYILCKLKLDAESMLGEQITEAVITVPSCFNDAQRQATKDAGKIAGLEVKHILNESTAAALAYSLDKKRNETIAVYDLGGGTFDISILEVGDGVVEVKSSNGDAKLGGDDIDQRVVEWIVGQFKKENGIDLSGNRTALRRLKEAAEQAKVELSAIKETEINLTSITADASGPKHLQMTLTRARFEQMIEDVIQRTVGPCKQALSDAGITPDHIDEVVLVGGQTRMPRVRTLVRELFGREPRKDVNTDELVALGAAVQGGAQTGEVKDLLLLDVTPVSLGIETMGGVFTKLIDRNTTIPTRKSETFSTAAANQTSVEIKIYQGERPLARDNRLLGIFQLMGIPPAPRGVPQIEVTFDIDSSGILKISAKDRATGEEQRVTISGRTGLSSQELPQIKKRLQAFDLAYRNSRGLAAPSTRPTSPVQKKPLDEREPARMNPVPPTPSPLRDKVPHFQERTVVREAAVNETGKQVTHRVLKDQYELLAEVGRGGFGAVYKARDIHLDQFVAVKELILEDTSPLKDEAKVLSDLRHRNIVGFRQLFPDQGRWYMVMDFVEGANLAKLISTRSLYAGGVESSLKRMLLIAHHAADGLHCAHDHGIIHQDMKPANVMVDANGVAKVSDFGLAKARQQSMNIGSPGGRNTIMISGKGFTPAYCSPEQATGDKLTRRTDTWSWGLCVLEMFAGHVTWTSGVLAREALAKYGSMQERRRDIPVLPQRLNNLLARCFQEESQMRPDMAEIAASIAAIESAGTGNWLKRFLK